MTILQVTKSFRSQASLVFSVCHSFGRTACALTLGTHFAVGQTGYDTVLTAKTLKVRLEPQGVAALQINPRTYVQANLRESTWGFEQVGLHLKGNYGTFHGIEGKPSLTLNLAKFGAHKSFNGMEKIHLNNSMSDPALMAEALGHELFNHASLPSLRTDHVRIELNRRALGLYVLVEGYGKRFLNEHFSLDRGNLYDSEFRHDITEPLRKSRGRGPDDHSDLALLARAAQEADPGMRIKSLAAVLNLNQFYSFLSLELMTCHFDGYARSINNYWLYHDPSSEKFVFLPYGMDQMFWDPESSLFPQLEGIVAAAVLGTAEGRKEYWERCRSLFHLFPPLTNRIEELYGKLRPEVVKDGTNAVARFDGAVQELRERVGKRIGHLQKHLFVPDPTLLELNANQQTVVTNWLWSIEKGAAKMEQLQGSNFRGQSSEAPAAAVKDAERLASSPGEKRQAPTVLRACFDNSHKSSIVTWESRLLLPKGTYLIVARTACNEPVFRGPNTPVGLKLWGGADLGAETVRIDPQHLDVLHPFRIDSDQEEILLQCQLQNAGKTLSYEVYPVVIRRLE